MVGIPAFLPMDPATTAGFYFVTAREGAKAGNSSGGARLGSGAQSAGSSRGQNLGSGSGSSTGGRQGSLGSVPFEGLQLGPPLGKGGYGVVYRGLYQGQLVAVKVCLGFRVPYPKTCHLSTGSVSQPEARVVSVSGFVDRGCAMWNAAYHQQAEATQLMARHWRALVPKGVRRSVSGCRLGR